MAPAKPVTAIRALPLFRAPFAPADEGVAAALLAGASRADEAEARVDARASRLVTAMRARVGGVGGVEDFLHAYALSTKEGLALMVLAEALLRVPDAETADRLIEDKLKAGDWAHHDTRSSALLVSASAWTLGITARVIYPGETPEGIVEALVKRLGLPAVRAAMRQAMRLLGSHFVMGQTIEEALARAAADREYLYSFDMLGEGARTADDAERYFKSYANAIDAIGKNGGNAALPQRPGISVKLSALHPRYEPLSRERVLRELPPKLLDLVRMAKNHELNFTVDAEEADREAAPAGGGCSTAYSSQAFAQKMGARPSRHPPPGRAAAAWPRTGRRKPSGMAGLRRRKRLAAAASVARALSAPGSCPIMERAYQNAIRLDTLPAQARWAAERRVRSVLHSGRHRLALAADACVRHLCTVDWRES